MKIETKFNYGDDVWLMHSNRPYKTKIEVICVLYEGASINIKYNIQLPEKKESVKESLLSHSKEELLKSL